MYRLCAQTKEVKLILSREEGRDLYRCKAEGFLLYINQSLIDVFNQPYLIFILYKECKRRKCSISYDMPDPPCLFDRHNEYKYMLR
uniref:Uncharacterized protein n=1 Tax=Poecilia reticulata TaxID=8081 RepID=A0A3P9Q273_POERE